MNSNSILVNLIRRSQLTLTYCLLLTVIIIWAIAWPVSKIGLIDMPPIWYTAMRLCIGFVTLFIILLCQKKIVLPRLRDLPLVLSIGILQMASFLLLLNGGLLFVEAGRSAILVYSTPFIVTPIAILFFNEKLTKTKLIGLIFGLLGLVVLFNPWSFNWHNSQVVIGNALLLLAAMCWAIAMLHTHYGKWHTSSLYLVPWQLLIASLIVLVTAFVMQPHPAITWTYRLILTGAYNGIFATGFAYAAIIYVSRKLPVTSTSLLLLGVPVLGLLFSAWWLEEKLTWQIFIAIILILSGLASIALGKRY
jgi:drug/metabolite transporter (DMT)-like permease